MRNGHLVPSFIKLWNYLAGKHLVKISKILCRMKPSKLVFFFGTDAQCVFERPCCWIHSGKIGTVSNNLDVLSEVDFD